MPRNSSGVYTLPPAYLAVVDADIVPEQHNTPLEDIAGEITKSVATDGRTVMTGELRLFGDPTLPLGAVPKQYADRPKATTTVALTSSNVTLTEAQCAVGRLLLTGTLTASVSVTLPTLAIGEWIVDNRTTGSYSVTIASAGAGTSLTALQSTRTPIWHDGTNIWCSADGAVAANSVTVSKLALGAWADVASASTVDLGAQTTRNVRITGTTTITSFGSTATPDNVPFQVRFTAAVTITRGASLETPTGASITAASGDAAVIVQETTGNWRIVSYARASNIALVAATTGASTVVQRDANGTIVDRRWDVVVEDQRASGTGGGATASNVWTTRPLSTIVDNAIGATLATNLVTLPAGTYEIEWDSPIYHTTVHRSRLYNVSDSTAIALGTNEYQNNNLVMTRSFGRAYVTFASSKQISLDYYAVTADANGLGIPSGLGTEIYGRVRVKRVG